MKKLLIIIFSALFISCNAQKSCRQQTDSLKKEIHILQCDNKKLTEELKTFKDSTQAYRKRDEELRFWIQSLLNRE